MFWGQVIDFAFSDSEIMLYARMVKHWLFCTNLEERIEFGLDYCFVAFLKKGMLFTLLHMLSGLFRHSL